jgi:hypothetical protein
MPTLLSMSESMSSFISSDCDEVYTMQSVFLGRLGTPGIEIEYSPNLESMLSLPYGWTYRSRFLT